MDVTYHAKVIAGGKIVIPADLRREFDIKDGDTVAIEREDGGGINEPGADIAIRVLRGSSMLAVNVA